MLITEKHKKSLDIRQMVHTRTNNPNCEKLLISKESRILEFNGIWHI